MQLTYDISNDGLNDAVPYLVVLLMYDISRDGLSKVAPYLVLSSPTFGVGVASDGTMGEDLLGLTICQGDLVVGIGADEGLVFRKQLLVSFVAFFQEFILSPLALRVQVTFESVVKANLVAFIHRNYFALRVFNCDILP